MATKLFLRNTQNNGIGANYFDMVTTAGSGTSTGVVNTAGSGTEIQWTQTAGGSVLQFISGRVPAGGFTLTSTDISIWAQESNGTANCGGRYRVFKRTSGGVETELGGGPFDDGVEFGTSAAEMTWTGNVTDTAFAEDDRILLKIYITNIGTMGSGRTCTITYNGADAATGDSFFNIAETVTFKSEDKTLTPSLFTNSNSFPAATVSATNSITPSLFTNTQSFFAPTVSSTYPLTPGLFTNTQTFPSATVTRGPVNLSPSLLTNSQTFPAATVSSAYTITPNLFTNSNSFPSATVTSDDVGDKTLTPSLFTNTSVLYSPSVALVERYVFDNLPFNVGLPLIRFRRKR